MNILITGAGGFIGKNLICALENIRDGKDRSHPELSIGEIFRCTRQTTEAELKAFCAKAEFVFHLAGVNRPKEQAEFMAGNRDFTGSLLKRLEEAENPCPVMLSSSTQAALDNPYGESKRAGERLLRDYGERTGAKTLIYRFPNVFGKWCRPNYNSAVATFCHNRANDLPIQVNDRSTRLTLVYIDDVVQELLAALGGREHRDGDFCCVPVTHSATLGEIVDLIERFRAQPETLVMPEIPNGSFAKKLYSTFLSYLPKEKVAFPLKMNVDARGSFTELLKTANNGQFSVNISKPGITKGQHWHNTKWEFFIVVCGHGLIQERRIGSEEVIEFEVSGEKIEAVHMLPGYTHNIINLSETENLVTLMWANEQFDPNRPDTFYQEV
jgi:UDP-2-acetamido-2,6-beta-L-arabino-hexul-4-ose reductase